MLHKRMKHDDNIEYYVLKKKIKSLIINTNYF